MAVPFTHILFHLFVLLASLFIIAKSGNYFVDALTRYVKTIGMSKYFIGMVVVAVATSSPDIAASIMGLLNNKFEILSGVVLGGLMLDLAFLNGWFAVLGKKIVLKTDVIKGIEFIVLGLMLLPYILLLDGDVTRGEGLAMVMSFFIYIALIWQREQSAGKLKQQIKITLVWKDMLIFLLALLAMLLAAKYAVTTLTQLSHDLNLPLYLLSLTILSLAAALPDAIAGTTSIIKGKGGEIGFGENIGTTLLEINLFTGIIALIHPLKLGVTSILTGVLGLMISSIFFLTILRKGVITRRHGYVFLTIYFVFLTIEIVRVGVLG